MGNNQALQVGAEALSGIAGGLLAAVATRLSLIVMAAIAILATVALKFHSRSETLWVPTYIPVWYRASAPTVPQRSGKLVARCVRSGARLALPVSSELQLPSGCRELSLDQYSKNV